MNCKYCFVEIEHYAGTGRIPEYCCNACRQAHYRLRKNNFQRVRRSAQIRAIHERQPLRNTTGAGRLAPDNTPNGYKQMEVFQ
ncbi:hypothetical protein [Methylomonas koyamae]|uniref:Uncharacterized protein n=1 Tax=Methylomonas koyamae TaxID=702114 RepID=A0A291IJY4_9GAMM|nr:hypothetical protein [Methylomonas koyamae]ATG90516.1 hypothetical protein MKLM6_2293 [Methylomonas koyamae]OAI22730.1 hypothetical protein A1356_18985 [Methylomonas koyamae]